MLVFPHRAKIRPASISWPAARVAVILIEAFLASGFESGPGASTLILIFLFLMALAIFFKWYFENRQLKHLATRRDDMRLESEERFSKAFNAGPEPLTISTISSGEYIDVNEAFLRITGYRREEVIGRSASDLKFWTDPDARPRLLAALQSGPVREMEITFATKSGETRSALLSAEVIEVGGQQWLLAVTKDVTHRKKAEAQIKASKEKFRKAFMTGADAF